MLSLASVTTGFSSNALTFVKSQLLPARRTFSSKPSSLLWNGTLPPCSFIPSMAYLRLMSTSSNLFPLEHYFKMPIAWRHNPDHLFVPYVASHDGQKFQIAIHDFPDDHLFSLWVNDQQIGKFDDWPKAWGSEPKK